MITKEQAQNNKNFLQVHTLEGGSVLKACKWRANGKCKTWKRQSESFNYLLNTAYIATAI